MVQKELKVKTFSALCADQYDISQQIHNFMKDNMIDVITTSSQISKLDGTPVITVVIVYREKPLTMSKEGAERLKRAIINYNNFMDMVERNSELSEKIQ